VWNYSKTLPTTISGGRVSLGQPCGISAVSFRRLGRRNVPTGLVWLAADRHEVVCERAV